jgi:hypothetical protein
LANPRAGRLEEGACVQFVVGEVVECAALQLIGAGADGDAEEPASGAPVLRVEGIGDHAEFANVLDGRPGFLDAGRVIHLAARGAIYEYLAVARR